MFSRDKWKKNILQNSPVQFHFRFTHLEKEKDLLLKIYIKLYGSDISPLSQEKET